MNEFMHYLASNTRSSDHLPSLEALGTELGISVGKLREQMEVARSLGLIEVRPHTGIRRAGYDFTPAVSQSLSYAIAMDSSCFDLYGDLRIKVEVAFLRDAAASLLPQDLVLLRDLIAAARKKLETHPVHIPHEEHRRLHLTIYSRLGNPFVLGLLQAYWDMYEAVGLGLFADYTYLRRVWDYHEAMVEAIAEGDLGAAERAFLDHTRLLRHREAEGQAAAIRSSVPHS